MYAMYRVQSGVKNMRDIKVIKNAAEPAIRISPETVYNILCSVCIVDQEVQNLSPWVDHTRSILNESDRSLCGQSCEAAQFVPQGWNASFDDWLAYFAALDAATIRRTILENLLSMARWYLPGQVLPDIALLGQDRLAFGNLVHDIHRSIGEETCEDKIDKEFATILNPEAWRDSLSAFLSRIWSDSLRAEWTRVQSMVDDSVRAFRETLIPGANLEERLCFLTGRDSVPALWMGIFERMEEIIWVPSPHIGPYLLLFHRNDRQAWFVSRTRLPKGSSIHSVLLDRADLLIRLNALGDPVRLEIVQMAAKDALTTQMAMDSLGLTQSSASRHLTQLAATGILSVDTGEKTKRYSLNKPRYEEIIQSLRGIAGDRDAPGGS
jgi:DNA-binding transcriptional ArsR family regulator